MKRGRLTGHRLSGALLSLSFESGMEIGVLPGTPAHQLSHIEARCGKILRHEMLADLRGYHIGNLVVVRALPSLPLLNIALVTIF